MYQLKIISEIILDSFDVKHVESSISFSKNSKTFDMAGTLRDQKIMYQNVIVYEFEDLNSMKQIDTITIRWDLYKELQTSDKQLFDIVVDSIIDVFHVNFPEPKNAAVFLLRSRIRSDCITDHFQINGWMSLYGDMETIWNTPEVELPSFINKETEESVGEISKQVFGSLPAEIERNIIYREKNVILDNGVM